MNILIVEDNPGDARLLEIMLQDIFLDSLSCSFIDRLKLAEDLLKTQSFDVILLDLNLPDSNGLQTLYTLKRMIPTSPIIVLTGLDDERVGLEAMKTGAQDFLVKGKVDEYSLMKSITYARERQSLANRLALSEKRVRQIVETSSDGLLVVNQDGVITFVNPAAEKILMMSSLELIGNPFRYPCEDGEVGERIIRHGTEEEKTVELRCVAIDWEGEFGHLVSLRDVSSRVKMEAKLREMATHDHLTGLPNRALFEDRLKTAIERNERQNQNAEKNRELAILLIDLDDFKLVNDTHGHPQGDLLLKEISSRLSFAIRKSDTVARLGGDEFVVILEELHCQEDVEVLINRILEVISKPIELEDAVVNVSASVGISHYPKNGYHLNK